MRRPLAAVVLLAVGVTGGCATSDATADGPVTPSPRPAVPATSTSPPAEPEATTSPGAVPPALERFYAQDLAWEPCREAFECATLEVPLDYDDPAGATIDLALLRAPATDPGRRVASLLVNPGGPGASGVDYAASADAVVTPGIRRVFDVVGFDPRGVGQSAPVECLTDAELDEALNEPLDATPDTPEEVEQALADQEELVGQCQDRAGDLLPHVGTADVARDLDVLRAALGEDRLFYLGSSYGTTIGAEYARQFPTRVGRMVLDGAIDPAVSWDDLVLAQAAGLGVSLTRFAQWCVAEGCSLGRSTDEVLGVVSQVLDAVDEQPLPTSSRPLTASLAFNGVVTPLRFSPEQGFPLLEAGLAQAIAGDGTTLLALADAILERTPDGAYPGNTYQGGFRAVNCIDKPSTATAEDVIAALPDYQRASPQLGERLAWSLLSCLGWPAEGEPIDSEVAARGSPPIVVVGTTEDPITPYAWAEALADQLSSGVLVTYEGTRHLAFGGVSACVDAAVDAYLVDGVVPEEGLRCS